MQYRWMFGTATLTEADLAKFTAKHAHEFYAKANRFTVQESDGYRGRGGSESVYREDAFQTAAEFYGVPYDVFYTAWIDEVPVNIEAHSEDDPRYDANLAKRLAE